MSRHHPFWQLFVARMKEFAREPEVVFWVFGFPILLSLGLGVAFRERGPERVFVAVVDRAGAREIEAALAAARDFDVVRVPEPEADRRLRLAKAALVVDPGPPVEYRYDPARPESAVARLRVDDALQRAAGRADRVAFREREVREPGSRYIDFLIPGLLGMNIMSGGMWGVGYALVELRVRKLLKRLAATPMRRSHFLGAMMASRMVLVFGEVLLLLGFGWLVFSLAVRGSVLSIAIVAALGAFTFASVGLAVAARPQKTESVTGWMNLVMLPMFVFSGVFFSSDRFPAAAQPFIKALPLTALNDALRGVILEGSSLAQQGTRLAILAAWGGLSFLLALRTFRWT